MSTDMKMKLNYACITEQGVAVNTLLTASWFYKKVILINIFLVSSYSESCIWWTYTPSVIKADTSLRTIVFFPYLPVVKGTAADNWGHQNEAIIFLTQNLYQVFSRPCRILGDCYHSEL